VPEKPSRRASAPRPREEEKEEYMPADGAIARLVDRACDNPAMSGGLFVMALTATAIVSNAMFLQNVPHPGPLFATRPAVSEQAPVVAQPAPAPLPREREEVAAPIMPPLPRPAPVASDTHATTPANPLADEVLIRETQKLLAAKGLYLGALDGKYGALSRSAISKYQTEAGLPVTGEPSVALLEHMRQPPAPPPAPVVEAPVAPAPVAAAPAPIVEAPPAPPPAPVRDAESIRYERVQMALNRIGYGPVAVDGNADEATVNAIRRFELDNGLPVTGKAGDELVERLVAIGALPAT